MRLAGNQVANQGQVRRGADSCIRLDEYPDNHQRNEGQGKGKPRQAQANADHSPQHVRRPAPQRRPGPVAVRTHNWLHEGSRDQSAKAQDSQQRILGPLRGHVQHQGGQDDGFHGKEEAGQAEAEGPQPQKGQGVPVHVGFWLWLGHLVESEASGLSRRMAGQTKVDGTIRVSESPPLYFTLCPSEDSTSLLRFNA